MIRKFSLFLFLFFLIPIVKAETINYTSARYNIYPMNCSSAGISCFVNYSPDTKYIDVPVGTMVETSNPSWTANNYTGGPREVLITTNFPIYKGNTYSIDYLFSATGFTSAINFRGTTIKMIAYDDENGEVIGISDVTLTRSSPSLRISFTSDFDADSMFITFSLGVTTATTNGETIGNVIGYPVLTFGITSVTIDCNGSTCKGTSTGGGSSGGNYDEVLGDIDSSLKENTESQNKTNDLLENDDVTESNDEYSNFFNGFSTDTFGLTSIITSPLELIASITSSTCSPVGIPIPYVNKTLNLPCLSTIYSEHFGAILTIYQTITFGITAYWVCVQTFNLVKDFKNPDHDEIEVLDL